MSKNQRVTLNYCLTLFYSSFISLSFAGVYFTVMAYDAMSRLRFRAGGGTTAHSHPRQTTEQNPGFATSHAITILFR